MEVLILGATGLTGRACLEVLLAAPEVTRVVAPVRRVVDLQHDKLELPLVDFDRLDEYAEVFTGDVMICCLGTTFMKARSFEKFRKVDYQYCLEAAKLARANGVSAFLLMSAVGASSGSLVFYLRVKGELEDALKDLGFERLSIYHPGPLLGQREEPRGGEAPVGWSMPMLNLGLIGPFRRYRAIEASQVARAMANEARTLNAAMPRDQEVLVREYEDIRELASGL